MSRSPLHFSAMSLLETLHLAHSQCEKGADALLHSTAPSQPE